MKMIFIMNWLSRNNGKKWKIKMLFFTLFTSYAFNYTTLYNLYCTLNVR